MNVRYLQQIAQSRQQQRTCTPLSTHQHPYIQQQQISQTNIFHAKM
jgi:hypothetical protein